MLELFIKYIQYERKFSEHTVREYENDISLFEEFLRTSLSNVDPFTATSKDVRAWVLYLLNKGESKTTIHRRISTLKSFYKYYIKNGSISKNPAQNVLLPKKPKRIPYFLEEAQIDNLFAAIDFPDTFQGERDKMIIMMLYLSGIRRAELMSIKKTDFDSNRNNIIVTGKRNKQRVLPLPQWFSFHLGEYIKIRDKTFGLDNDYLFVTDKGKPLYDKFVYLVVRKYLDQITTMLKRSPHTLRHTFATHMLNAGADLNAIKELLGHSSLAATQVYTHSSFEKLKKTYKQTHPRS